MIAVARFTGLELARWRVLPGLAVAAGALVTAAGMARRPGLQPVVLEWLGLAASLLIGGTVLGPELRSGAADLLWSRPVRRSAYAAGKLLAAVAALLAVTAAVALLSVPVILVRGGGREVSLELVLAFANGVPALLLVMLVSIRLSTRIAALFGFIAFEAAGAVTAARAIAPGPVTALAGELLPHRLTPAWHGPADVAGCILYGAVLGSLLAWRLSRRE